MVLSNALSAGLYFAAAFPFVVQLIPGTDTQPAFVILCVIAVTLILCQSSVSVRKNEFFLLSLFILGGLFSLCASLLVNEFKEINLSRIVSFVMFLISMTAALWYRSLFNPQRIYITFIIYALFTCLFFVSNGWLESILIQSRGDAITTSLSTGRGASTLSPEQSFFSFQIFTLYLVARLCIWDEFSGKQKSLIEIIVLLLLISSFGGYGIVYVFFVFLMSSSRSAIKLVMIFCAALIFVLFFFNWTSLRSVVVIYEVFITLVTGQGISDVSVNVRFSSFLTYFDIIRENFLFGDSFSYHGGGGLVSLVAGLGMVSLIYFAVFIFALANIKRSIRLKISVFFWFILQSISGPIGLPLIGLLFGLVMVIYFRELKPIPQAVESSASRSRIKLQENSNILVMHRQF